MAHLGRRLRDSDWAIDFSQLPSPSSTGVCHPNHSADIFAIRAKNRAMFILGEDYLAGLKPRRRREASMV